jgi:penicillin-insensitive murein endopeptidase
MSHKHSFRRIAFGFCLSGCLALVSAAQASPWSKVKSTAPGPAAAIGGPSNGCIAGAEALTDAGTGFVSIRRHRNRYYGHPETVRLVRDLGWALNRRTKNLMMVGDLSQPRGGLMSSMHRSHQNGMDVDIWFSLTKSARSAEKKHPEQRDPVSMVAPSGNELNENWGEHQRFLLKTAAEDPRVDRIMVNPAIKRALCRSESGSRKWLRKLRPWWGHDAHFHVRLKCPKGSSRCKQQAPVPAGDGCDKTLAWWFSDEARTPSKKSSKKKKARPSAPAVCRALLSGI